MDLKELVRNWNSNYGDRLPISEDLLEHTFFALPTSDRAIVETEDMVALLRKDEDVTRIHLAAPQKGRSQVKVVGGCMNVATQQAALWHSKKIVYGGGEKHIFPGVPINKDTEIWMKELKPASADVHDFEGSLKELQAQGKDAKLTPNAQWRPANDKREEIQIIDFVRTEFAGRWLNEICEDSLRGFMDQYHGLFVGGEIKGYARMYGWRSDYWAPGVYFSGPGRGMAGIGPIGVAKHCRSQGVGKEMLYRSWDVLLSHGCQSVRVDWSLEIDFFTSVGLSVVQSYRPAYKSI